MRLFEETAGGSNDQEPQTGLISAFDSIQMYIQQAIDFLKGIVAQIAAMLKSVFAGFGKGSEE